MTWPHCSSPLKSQQLGNFSTLMVHFCVVIAYNWLTVDGFVLANNLLPTTEFFSNLQ